MAESTALAEYTIPARSGETLIVPPLDRLPSLVAPYAPEGASGATILGLPLAEVRRAARARALALAAWPGPAACGARADDRPGRDGDAAARPLVLMGHQPVFVHPGVWVKYFLLSRLCGVNGARGLHLVVDTDAVGPVVAPVPTAHDGVGRTSHTLVALPDNLPLEAAPVPAPRDWAAFIEGIRRDLGTLGVPGLTDRLMAFAAGESAARRDAGTLAGYLDVLRREYEGRAGAPRYADLAVSALSATPEFHAFALHLLQDPRGLLDAYNGCLDAYREAHRVRSPANPFPDLMSTGEWSEAPFWVLHEGRRADLCARREGNQLALGCAGEPLATVPAGPEGVSALAASGLALRPKAITLTMFARLCVGDLFIHGVGGGRYDRVTDALTERLFGVRPAPYAVATATLHLPLAGRHRAGERHAIERRLMDLRHNPDRHLAAAGEAERRLIDEKWTLIREGETLRPGPQRRAATRRIREINGRLAEALAPEIVHLEAHLETLRAAPPAEDALEFRGYPYFLFEPGDVAALVGGVTAPLAPPRP